MEVNKFENAIRFYLLATTLKDKIRSGWDKNHWDVTKERVESVAEYVYGTCILAISLDSEFDFNVNLDKVIKMLVIHEIGEVIIGDITPFDNVSPEEKMKREHDAILKVIGNLVKKEELISLLLEFDEKVTKEAIFAYHCDKLEADLQAKLYQDMGYQKALDCQENNVVLKNKKARKIVENGATTAFDVWYEWDKHLYDDDKIFAQILEYVKGHLLTLLLSQNKS